MNSAKIPETSSNKCEECKRPLLIQEGREFCFYCEVIAAEDKKLAAAAKEQFNRMKIDKLQEHFNLYSIIPPKLKKATFDSYTPKNSSQETALKDCLRYANNFSMNLAKENDIGLLLHGPFGLGKSHLAVAIAKRVIELGATIKKPDGSEGITCIFVNLPELVTKIKSTWRKDSAISEAELLDMLKTCDLLIIDELGGALNRQDEQGQSWLNDILFQITDARQGRNTIYTANPTPEELQQHVSPKIYERIFYNIHILEFEGKSHRLGGEF